MKQVLESLILPFSILYQLCLFSTIKISNSQCCYHEEKKFCRKICLKIIKGHIPVYYISYTVGDKKLYSEEKEKPNYL